MNVPCPLCPVTFPPLIDEHSTHQSLQDNLSPLHVAAGMGHIDVTKRLLDNGADMEAEDNALYTPLWRAAYYGHPEVVEVRSIPLD